jgi:hypothetical protein
MERKYQLQVTSDTTRIDVQSVNSDEVARIAQLAGLVEPFKGTTQNAVTPVPQDVAIPVASDQISAEPIDIAPDAMSDINSIRKNAGMAPMTEPMPSDISIDEPISGDLDIDQSGTDDALELEENQAEYDYGHKKFEDEGEEIDLPEYIWQAVENPQRIKGSPGDNGLIQELHNHLLTQYEQYLAEAERENDDGIMSPLSDPTKPSFDKDPLSDEEPVDDGSHSPMSTVVRQHAFK